MNVKDAWQVLCKTEIKSGIKSIGRRYSMATNTDRSFGMECGYLKSKSGTGAQVRWDKSDKCVYWNGHLIGHANSCEEAVAKARTWIQEHVNR